MKVKNKKNGGKPIKINKKVVIFAVIILLIIILVICLKSRKSDDISRLDEFEKCAIYNYLEDNVLEISKLYQTSGKSEYNEIQIFQSKLKQELDSYFSKNDKKSISTSEALGLVDSKYIPANVDFHGIIVSGYKYNPEKETLIKSDDAYSNMAGIEAEINSIDYSNEKVKIQNLEKNSDTQYTVTFNIVDRVSESNISDNGGTAIISVKDGEFVIDSCSFTE